MSSSSVYIANIVGSFITLVTTRNTCILTGMCTYVTSHEKNAKYMFILAMASSYLLFCMCYTNSVTLIEFLWISAYVIKYNSFVTKFIRIKSYYFLNSQNRSNFTCS